MKSVVWSSEETHLIDCGQSVKIVHGLDRLEIPKDLFDMLVAAWCSNRARIEHERLKASVRQAMQQGDKGVVRQRMDVLDLFDKAFVSRG